MLNQSILMKQEMMCWRWHQLHHMQIICTSFQTDNHASISSHNLFTGRMLFLMPSQFLCHILVMSESQIKTSA